MSASRFRIKHKGRATALPGPVPSVEASLSGPAAVPVVGTTWSVTPATYSVSPVLRSYQWKRGGEAISGAVNQTYTVTDADAASATRGLLSCTETAIFATGPSGVSTTADSAMPRRTHPTLAYDFGALTRAGYGAVALANSELGLLGTGAAAASTWTCALTSGTAGQFNVATGLRTPSAQANGVTAGTYVFTATYTPADGLAETQEITVTVLADIYTLGQYDSLSSFWTAVGTAASGKTIAFATGATFPNTRRIFQNWRFTSTTTLKPHDANRPSPPLSYEFLSCQNITADDLVLGESSGSANARIALMNSGTGSLATDSMTFNRTQITGSAGLLYCFRLKGATNITINDALLTNIYGGISQDGSDTLGCTNVVVNNLRIRYFNDNGWLLGATGGAVSSFTFNDPIIMAPIRKAGSLVHADFGQTTDYAVNTTITVNRMYAIQADGDAYCQGIFGGRTVAAANAPTYVINGYCYVGRATHALSPYASKDCQIANVTMWKTDSGEVSTASTENDGYVELGPWFFVGGPASTHGGASTLDKSVIFGTASDGDATTWTITGRVHAHGGTRTSPPTSTGFQTANPKTALDTLTYEGESIDDIVAGVNAILRPSIGGAYQDADTTYDGAFNPDGSWAA